MVQGMEKIRVIIDNTQKEVKIPTGMRMLVRRSLQRSASDGKFSVSGRDQRDLCKQ